LAAAPVDQDKTACSRRATCASSSIHSKTPAILRAVPTLILLLVAAVLALPVLALLGAWTQWDAATAQILRR
jgi:hypothetical protein